MRPRSIALVTLLVLVASAVIVAAVFAVNRNGGELAIGDGGGLAPGADLEPSNDAETDLADEQDEEPLEPTQPDGGASAEAPEAAGAIEDTPAEAEEAAARERILPPGPPSTERTLTTSPRSTARSRRSRSSRLTPGWSSPRT
jgi:hypothetical protein